MGENELKNAISIKNNLKKKKKKKKKCYADRPNLVFFFFVVCFCFALSGYFIR